MYRGRHVVFPINPLPHVGRHVPPESQVPEVPLGPVAPSFEVVGRDHVRQAGVDVQHLGSAQHGPVVVEDPSGSPELCV